MSAYSAYSRMKNFFEGGEFHHYERGGELRMDWQHLRGMALSLSHTPRVDDPRFPEFEQSLEGILRPLSEERRPHLGDAVLVECRPHTLMRALS